MTADDVPDDGADQHDLEEYAAGEVADADYADDEDDPFAALGALFGGGFGGGASGKNPLAGLLEQAQQMQAGMEDAQRRLAEQTVSGTSGGGLVRATVSGTGELQQLRIDPSVVDPTDVETLADLIIAAVRAAAEEARTLGERTMSGALPVGVAGLPDFGGPGGLGGFGGGLGLPTTIPDLGAGLIPGGGPVGRPIGDEDSDDDLGPSGDLGG